MFDFFARALAQAQRAETVAAELRKTHRDEAEEALQTEINRTPSGDPRDALLRDALRALRWVR